MKRSILENVMKYKILYLVISLVVLIPGTISLFVNGLNLSVDFAGGSVVKYEALQSERNFKSEINEIFIGSEVEVENIQIENSGSLITVRVKELNTEKNEKIKEEIEKKYEDLQIKQVSFETVGPAVGRETTKNAFVALGWASLGIMLYIAFAFRNIPKPFSSFRFGISAIIAMLHDALLVLGIASILGKFVGFEIDSLFIPAILTVIGFSVHDSIVVFDRIRENLRKLPKSWNFEGVVNYSIVETLNRSLATSLTVIFTLLALYLLGGESIKDFVLIMLIGIVSGTYSSIFTASPVLVVWENWISRKGK